MRASSEKEQEIRFLGDLHRLELKPGDRFVLTMPGPITVDISERLQSAWRKFVGGDDEHLKLLILQSDMKLGVIATKEES